MYKNRLNISDIEKFIVDIIWKKVSDNVFVGDLPSAIDSKLKDMVVIDCSNTINNMNAFGYGTVNIIMYANPTSDGMKDEELLGDMCDMLTICVEENKNPSFGLTIGNTYSDYDTNRKLHCNIVQLKIVII